MAKKKRKKKRSGRPAARPQAAPPGQTTAEADRPVSARAERKEQARRERERRIRQARRRRRMRRGARWGAVLGLGAAIGLFAYVQVRQGREVERRATEAAGQIGCSAIETQADAVAGLSQAEVHSPPFAQGAGGVPATVGRHSSPLPADPHVYDQPIPEANAVHNLEHGYVIIYYAKRGDHALPDEIVTALEGLARSETKVLMAPYPDLANSLDLAAWRKLQSCDPPPQADPDDAVTVARGFIEQFRAGGLAPEPAGV
jgi:uncharacterized protein DUF3105